MNGIIATVASWAATQSGTGIAVHHGVFQADDSASRREPFLSMLYDETSQSLARRIDIEREWQQVRPSLKTHYRFGVADQ